MGSIKFNLLNYWFAGGKQILFQKVDLFLLFMINFFLTYFISEMSGYGVAATVE